MYQDSIQNGVTTLDTLIVNPDVTYVDPDLWQITQSATIFARLFFNCGISCQRHDFSVINFENRGMAVLVQMRYLKLPMLSMEILLLMKAQYF